MNQAEPPGRWRAVVENSRDLVVLIGASGRPLYINPAVREVMGFEPEELISGDPLSLIHPEDRPEMLRRMAVMDTDEHVHGPAIVRVQHKDGSWRWIEVLASNQLDDPAVAAILVNARDITQRIAAEHAIESEKEHFRHLVEALPDAVVTFGPDLEVRYINPAAESVVGAIAATFEPGELRSVLDLWIQPTYASLQEAAAALESRTFEIELPVGRRKWWLEVTVVPEVDHEGELAGLTTISHDITERKLNEAQLEQQVLADPLTGLANRAGFELEVSRALGGMGPPAEIVAVLYLDLDHFKTINDLEGHAAGDRFLRSVAERLRSAVRPDDLVARIGGDEFAVLPRGLGGRDEAEALASRVHHHLHDLAYEIDGRPVGTVSIGVAYARVDPRSPLSMQHLVDEADRAMYEAKRQGRDRTSVRAAPGEI